MAKLSSRVVRLNDDGSDGWEVFYRARRMVADGVPVVELTIGEHDIGTDASILEAMQSSASSGHTGYAAVPGTDALREAVAQRITERTGVATRRDNVLITPGGQAALFAAHMAACTPGDAALFIDPYYATYPGTIRAASAHPVPVRTEAAQNFKPDPAELHRYASDFRACSLLVNSPNNPTGTVYPQRVLESIASIVRARDMWLISDEVYDTQLWDGSHISPRAVQGMDVRTMVIGSMSKSHAMTGSRIGWLIAPEPVVQNLIDLATSTTYGVPGFIQDAALYALTQGPALEEQIAAPFLRRRALVLKALGDQSAIKGIPSQGAMYIMMDVRATGLSGREFAEQLLDAHHIAVMPGESFGRSAAGHIRVALTVEDDKLCEAVQTICTFAERKMQ